MWQFLDPAELDKEFLIFLEQDSALLNEKRNTETPLSSNEIMYFAKKVEEFLVQKLNLNFNEFKPYFAKLERKMEVKRNFVQKKVLAHFNNFEGKIPALLTEDEFVEIVLKGGRDEEMKQYARFAIFNEIGIRLHIQDSVFDVPRKNTIPFKSSFDKAISYQGKGKFVNTLEQNFGMVKYCIYCHKQKRDYCRTQNPISKTDGCPLDQKISEMNMLKSQGFILAPLLAMMIDNPLCILTGNRICNDCKKACIFQKQTPVDIPSIESQIVEDVINLPFGFEVYYLFTEWNPLLTKRFLPNLSNQKSVLVCGAGPAGILSSYYFLREGFDVVLMDGLKLSKTQITKPIKNANSILKQNRNNKGFGGVMEYGITERWNKNFLILAQILLERKKGFSLLGGKKFGTDITFEWAKNQKFCHVLMCIGAGRPKLPNELANLQSNIITASNFLMSANLNQGWLLKKAKSPILIIGAGLTAMDAALLAKQNGYEVLLIARGELKNSRAFLGNRLEVEDALFKGVKIFENRTLKQIIKDKFCIFINNKTQKEEVFHFGLLVFALGTEANLEPILQAKDREFFTILGDLDPRYEGSVVKAFASIKNQKEEIFAKLLNANKSQYKAQQDKIISKKNLTENFIEIKVQPAIKPDNCNIFDLYKLQILNTDLHPIPLTLFNFENNILTFIVKREGEGTKTLFNQECEILLTKSASNQLQFSQIVVDDKIFLQALKPIKNTILLEDFKENNAKTLFYIRDFNKIKHFKKNNYYVFLFTEMNCMLSGVCSRCLTQNSDDSFFYACKNHIHKINSIKYKQN